MKKSIIISIIFIIVIIGNLSFSFGNSEICKILINTTDNIKRNETLELLLDISDIDSNEGVSSINGLLEYDDEVFEDVKYEKSSEWSNFYELNNVLFIVTNNMEERYENSNLLKIKLKVKENAKLGKTAIKFSKIEILGSSNIVKTINDIEKNIQIEDSTNHDQDDDKDSTIDNNQSQDDEQKYINNESKNGKTVQNTSIADKILSKTGLGVTLSVFIIIAISIGVFNYIKYKKEK